MNASFNIPGMPNLTFQLGNPAGADSIVRRLSAYGLLSRRVPHTTVSVVRVEFRDRGRRTTIVGPRNGEVTIHTQDLIDGKWELTHLERWVSPDMGHEVKTIF